MPPLDTWDDKVFVGLGVLGFVALALTGIGAFAGGTVLIVAIVMFGVVCVGGVLAGLGKFIQWLLSPREMG